MNAAILYVNLAPFHFSRLERAGELWRARGGELTCIEIAKEQSNYSWGRSSYVPNSFQYLTLFDDEYFFLKHHDIRRAINQALDEVKPDVVVINGWGHTHSSAALGWCSRRGIPRVLISDSQEIDLPRRQWKEFVKKVFVSQCHAGFAGGTPQIRYLQTLGMPKEYCVPGCDVVDNKFFGEASLNGHKRNGDRQESLHLLSCLRFLAHKNIPLTLRALARVSLPWRWTLAGYGPEQRKIEGWITKLGLEDRVSLVGHVPYQSLPALFSKADVYLQPSLSEPWGLAVNEALASGLPVLVSRQCGCREDLVQEGINGFMFDPESPEDLVRAINVIWSRKEEWKEMGESSRQIIDGWSLDLFAESLWKSCEIATERAAKLGHHTSIVGGFCKVL